MGASDDPTIVLFGFRLTSYIAKQKPYMVWWWHFHDRKRQSYYSIYICCKLLGNMLSFPATNKVIFHDLTFQIRHQNKFLQAPDSHLKDFFPYITPPVYLYSYK